MARIQLKNISKRFGRVQALDNISLDIEDNSFFVLFGPAGAGKTTILNCIAGLTMPESGEILFDGKSMNLVDTAHRNIAMVFENYALYPQMTVYDNIASPLRSPLYREPEEAIAEKVKKVAKMMKMDTLLNRLPSQLSNGQKQRVAMGRALVREPNVFLMDEPLAHLDAKLRNAMRTELKELQSNFGSTSIYVTHDFKEAMSLGDRIAIVHEGHILQIGSGDAVYYMPSNEFVAQLMGDPEINLFSGRLRGEKSAYLFEWEGGASFPLPDSDTVYENLREKRGRELAVHIGVRPHSIRHSFAEKEGYLHCTVYSYESIGNKSVIVAAHEGRHIRLIAENGLQVRIDQPVYIRIDWRHCIFFDPADGAYITRYDEEAIQALIEAQEAG